MGAQAPVPSTWDYWQFVSRVESPCGSLVVEAALRAASVSHLFTSFIMSLSFSRVMDLKVPDSVSPSTETLSPPAI